MYFHKFNQYVIAKLIMGIHIAKIIHVNYIGTNNVFL